ncbi:DUF4351 domain-containing protein [Gammaproteobacteria bacterium]
MGKRKLVSFDWALKRLLRSKANFEVLEGFLSELLKDDITIVEILESESNKQSRRDKFNRVDLKVCNHLGEMIIIEVQFERELDYMQRILYATAKTITEHLKESQAYRDVIKVISVNILYFDLGHGEDYVYHGRTDFTGIHRHDRLRLSTMQQNIFGCSEPYALFPEYYLIKINQFDDVAHDPLDEWIYFLKHEEVKDGFTARGLSKAKEVLDVLRLSDEERQQYESFQEDLHYQASMYFSSYTVGKIEGKQHGLQEGRQEGRPEGEAKLLQRMLVKRFGELPEWVNAQLQAAKTEDLESWGEKLVIANSIMEIFGEHV